MRVRSHYCPACRAYLDTDNAIAEHNLQASTTGERQYTRIVGIVARTVEAHRIAQGAGVHIKPTHQ